MKKIKIPFSLEEYNKGGYEVETRDGKNARIVCTDVKGDHPIVSLILDEDNEEHVSCYSLDDIYNNPYRYPRDLFLVKNEFEDGDIVYLTNYKLDDIITIYGDEERPFFYNVKDNNISEWKVDNNSMWRYDSIRLATKKELKIFFAALKEHGKRWNSETKTIEDIPNEEQKHPFETFDEILGRDDGEDMWV